MKKSNIILISIDTLRADHLSCYGYNRSTTPYIDKLASEGTICRKNYSTGVWTPPGHASMLTGLYVSEHKVYGENRLSDDIPAVATIVKEHGYQTAGFVNNSQVGELVGFHKGHDLFVEVWKESPYKNSLERFIKGSARRAREYLGMEDMGAKRTNRLFLDWISRIDRGRPFYSFIHYIEPHNPLSPPKSFRKPFLRKYADINNNRVVKVAHNPLICYVEDLLLTDDEISYIKDLYDGELAYTDHIIGELISVLKAKQLYDNTMIIITSDHGEHFGEHGCWSHVASLYKEVLHVPLIIKYPGDVDNKINEINGYTQSIDILPTIIAVTGINSDIKLSGLNLLNNKYHEYILAEWEGRIPYFILNKTESSADVDLDKFKVQMCMIQDNQHKYIMKSDGSDEICGISDDGKEVKVPDVNEDTKNRLRKELMSKIQFKTESDESKKPRIDDEIVQNLKNLGYM